MSSSSPYFLEPVCISSSDRKAGVEIAAEHVNMNQCSPSRRPRALIVEDEVMIALGLQAEMESMGFEVCGLAANARQAISLQWKTSLILW